jgi:putative transposase
LKLPDEELRQLQSIAISRSMPHLIVQRAQIVLASGAGESNITIAKRIGDTGITVRMWRKGYQEFGIEGLHDEFRAGRSRTYPGLIKSPSQGSLPGLSAWAEVVGLASPLCPKATLPQPMST